MATAIDSALAAPTLPRCASSGGALALIEGVQKTNRKTSAKYDGYRKILQDATPLELATRLAYAETLAANCPQQEGAVASVVTSVIGNRIRIRGGDAKGVVFQRDQFSSSLNVYPESRYRDFLCPKDDALWKAVLAKMRANLEGSGPGDAIPKDAVNYYLYKHSDRFKVPNWKLAEVPVADEKTRACIRVFRNPAWK
jgi:hypothetical protein